MKEGGDWRAEDPDMYMYLMTTCLYTGWLQEHGFAHGHPDEDGEYGREAGDAGSQCRAP